MGKGSNYLRPELMGFCVWDKDSKGERDLLVKTEYCMF